MLRELKAEIEPHRKSLIEHPLNRSLNTLDDVRRFMEWHVFSVLDFMSLVKRLQRELTCLELPWTPPAHPEIARMINEIVLGEESDLIPGRQPQSHFELYLEAMREIGASTEKIDQFCSVAQKDGWKLASIGLPEAVSASLTNSLNIATEGTLPAVAGAFAFGRELIIPDLFSAIDPAQECSILRIYLERHIEIDGDSHGPISEKLVSLVCGNNEMNWNTATLAARDSLVLREKIWNTIQNNPDKIIRARRSPHLEQSNL